MCGRYRRTTSEEELARRYHIPIPPQRDLPISWNIAPTRMSLAIRFNPETKQRSLDALRWGLIPFWAKDSKVAYKTINARVETGRHGTVLPPSVQKALLDSGRWLLRVEKGFRGKYSVLGQHKRRFSAGLWEGWKDPATDEWLRTCTIITGEPNEFVRGDPYPYAGRSARRASRSLVIR
jgi:putative SOS response-associated peptidase YedK